MSSMKIACHRMPTVYIGIDPGTHKSGFASYSTVTQRWGDDCGQYTFEQLRLVLSAYQHMECVLMRLEDTRKMFQLYAYKMKNLYEIVNHFNQRGVAELLKEIKILIRQSNNVGMNAGACWQILYYLKSLHVPFELIVPSSSSLSGLNGIEMSLMSGVTEMAYPTLYAHMLLKSYEHMRDAMGLIVRDVPVKPPDFLQAHKPLNAYQQRVQQACAKSILTLQIQKNKVMRRRAARR